VLQPSQIEELMNLIVTLDRQSLLGQLQVYPARFPLDFTDEYLGTLSTEELRHIFMAVCLQNQRMPTLPGTQEAIL
jgi:hypothetical protein